MSNKIPDVFHSFLVNDATYSGKYEIPKLKPATGLPIKVIPFSRAISSSDYECYVLFYEHDAKFIRIWNNPTIYVPILQKFKGVISPDFSLYRNMPLSMQIWNTYRGKALAYFWQKNDIDVIPNVRFGDARTFEFCFDGVPRNSIISIGTLGCIHRKEDRACFRQGLTETIKRLSPKTIIIYGSMTQDIFDEIQRHNITIIHFDSETANYYKSKTVLS